MKLALVPVNVGVGSVEKMVELGVTAEQIGLESVWTFEHVIVPVDYQSKYPYSMDGKMGATPETNFVDPLIALAAIAASTKSIRLGTGVNILPQVSPLYLAKQAASLDFVSNGRFMLGVGIGWLAEEFAALGVPFERRGPRFNDYVEAMRKVWSGEVVEHQGEFVQWSGFKSHPTPLQDPLPLVIGGHKGRAFQRVARYGNGWFAPSATIDQISAMMKDLDQACAKEGRDRSTIEISTMWIPAMENVDVVKQYEDIGVHRLIMPLQFLGEGDPVVTMKKLADDVLSKIA